MDKPSDILEGALLSGRWKRSPSHILRFKEVGVTQKQTRCPLAVIAIEHGGHQALTSTGEGYAVYAWKSFGMHNEAMKAVVRNADSYHSQEPIAHLRSLGF